MKFGIAAHVAHFDRSRAPHFGITADVAGFDRTALRCNGGIASDISGGDRTAACPENRIAINVADVDISTLCQEVEIDIFRSCNLQNPGAVAGVLGLVFAAALVDLRALGLNFDDRFMAGGVHLQIAGFRPHDEGGIFIDWTLGVRGGNAAYQNHCERTADDTDRQPATLSCRRSAPSAAKHFNHFPEPTNCSTLLRMYGLSSRFVTS